MKIIYKQLLKLLLILLIPSLTQACLWLEGTNIDGDYKRFDDKIISSMFLKRSQNTTPQKNFKQRFYRENNQTAEYLALQYIMKGEYDKGIAKLMEIEKEGKKLYEMASNLGTAYELQGNIPLAIEWIEEGIKRNAESHGGTEWLHVLILETKLELENNATLLEHQHIITLPYHFTETTTIKIKDKNYTIKEVRDALFYQLRERLIFVKPKDKVVADLLYTFAKIEEQTTIVEEADKLLVMAQEYGFDNQTEIDIIYHNLNKSITNMRQKAAFSTFLILILVVFLLIIFIKIRKKRRKKPITKPIISPLSFAFSINVYIVMFTILSMPLYSFIHLHLTHTSMLYILMIFIYPLAIYSVLNDIEKRYIIPQPKQHILYSSTLYIVFSTVIYFFFLKNFNINVFYHFGATIVLAICIFFFLKWRMKRYE